MKKSFFWHEKPTDHWNSNKKFNSTLSSEIKFYSQEDEMNPTAHFSKTDAAFLWWSILDLNFIPLFPF